MGLATNSLAFGLPERPAFAHTPSTGDARFVERLIDPCVAPGQMPGVVNPD